MLRIQNPFYHYEEIHANQPKDNLSAKNTWFDNSRPKQMYKRKFKSD